MISDVPPSIELARARRNILRDEPSGASSPASLGRAERVVVADDAVGTEQVDAQLVGRLVHVRASASLAIEPSGPGLPARAFADGALVRVAQHLALDPQLRDAVAVDGVTFGERALAPQVERLLDARHAACRSGRPARRRRSWCARSSAWSSRRASRRRCPDAVGVGDSHIGEVHLVELGLAGDLAQRPHLDAGRVHVEHEVGQALVLRQLRDRCARRACPRSARCASVFHTFCPLTTHSSPSRTARVARPARSEPAPGSQNSWHQISSPVNIGRSARRAELVAAVGDHGRAREGETEEQRAVGGCAPASRSRRIDVALHDRGEDRGRRSLRESAPTPGRGRTARRAA